MGSSKILSVAAQIVLGWLLSVEDFAIYAIAISASSFVSSVRNGGVQRLLVQKGADYDRLAFSMAKIGLMSNAGIFLLLIFLSPILEAHFNADNLRYLIWIIAFSVLINTPAVIFRAKLSIDLRFASLSKVSVASAAVRYVSMIIFALLGLGAFSFVLPLVLVAIFEGAAYWRLAGSLRRSDVTTGSLFRELWPDMRWVLIGAIAAVSVTQGDYLVLGLMADKRTLGFYFFAFQLVLSVSVLFSSAIETVLTPSFVKISDDPERQRRAFLKSVQSALLILPPVIVCGLLFIDPVVNNIWQGKWNDSIPVMQLFLITMLTRLPMLSGLSLLEARGYWKSRTLVTGADGIGVVVSIIIGAWAGGLLTVAMFSSIYRFVSAGVFLALCGRISGIPIREFGRSLQPLLIVLAASVAVSLLSAWYFDIRTEKTIVALTMCGIFTVLWVAACYIACRPQCAALASAILPGKGIRK